MGFVLSLVIGFLTVTVYVFLELSLAVTVYNVDCEKSFDTEVSGSMLLPL
jgi:hypothetical protein